MLLQKLNQHPLNDPANAVNFVRVVIASLNKKSLKEVACVMNYKLKYF